MNARAHAVSAYRSQKQVMHDLITQHKDMVSRIAHHLIARMPVCVDVDDLIQAGTLGLMEAAKAFQDGQGATFETYASLRIRGAMLDELRRGDWVPRSVRRNYRAITDATRRAEQTLGRAATAQEIAAEAGMNLDEYNSAAEDAFRGMVLSYDMRVEDGDGEEPLLQAHIPDTPSVEYTREAFGHALAGAIDKLPEKEKLVLSLYFEQELTLKEIGLVLDVSESRISQILGQAKLRLRSRLRDWETRDALQETDEVV